MKFEEAKCPNCGASIHVPNDRKQANCMYCGSVLSVKEAIQKYQIEIRGNVSVSGVSSVDNDLLRARQCIAVFDFERAFHFYCLAIDKQANNFEAWHGALYSLTHSLSSIDLNWAKLSGDKSIGFIARNCLLYVPSESRIMLRNEIIKTRGLLIYAAYWEAIKKVQQIPKYQGKHYFKKRLIQSYVDTYHINYINYLGSLVDVSQIDATVIADVRDQYAK